LGRLGERERQRVRNVEMKGFVDGEVARPSDLTFELSE